MTTKTLFLAPPYLKTYTYVFFFTENVPMFKMEKGEDTLCFNVKQMCKIKKAQQKFLRRKFHLKTLWEKELLILHIVSF